MIGLIAAVTYFTRLETFQDPYSFIILISCEIALPNFLFTPFPVLASLEKTLIDPIKKLFLFKND